MEESRIRRAVYLLVLVLGGGAVAYLFFKHLFLAVLPFFLGWVIAFAVRRPAAAICSKIRMPERVARAILAGLVALMLIGILCLLGWALVSELWRLLSGLGEGSKLRDAVDRLTSGGIFGELFLHFGDRLGDVFYELLVSVATALGSAVTGWIGAVPKIFLFVIVSVIASVYLALDLERVNSTVRRYLPRGVCSWLSSFRRGFFTVGVRYLRSYLLLMLLTFVIMLAGLAILRRPYALLLAFIIAVLDVLPVLGVGTVLIPWSVIELISGDNRLGVGLLVLFGIYELIRQLAEPKIVAKQLGVHPFLTLLLIYLGYTLFGFVGILAVPLAVVLINITLGKDNSAEVEKSPSSEGDRA